MPIKPSPFGIAAAQLTYWTYQAMDFAKERQRRSVVGIALDEAGWVLVDALLDGCRRHGTAISPEGVHRSGAHEALANEES